MSGVKIVVLGGGFAGITAARTAEKAVKGSEVTLIEARDVAVQKFAAARGSVYGIGEDSFTKKMVIPMDQSLKRGKVLHERASAVSDKAVTLENGEEVEFDYLIVATGARNNFAEPPLDVTGKGDMEAYYETTSAAIEKAKKIVIIGGGPVGIELAGEICDKYTDSEKKEVSIVNSGNTLIMNDPAFKKGFTSGLEKLLKKRGVNLHLGAKAEGLDFGKGPFIEGEQTVKLSSGESIEADLVLLAIGTTRSTSIYPEEWLNDKKQVKVNEYLQLPNVPNVFAVGDLNDVAETKMGYFAMQQGPLAAKNIGKIVKKGEKAKLKAYKPADPTMIVPVGRKYGKAQFMGLILGSLVVSNIKGKGVFTSENFAAYGAKAPK